MRACLTVVALVGAAMIVYGGLDCFVVDEALTWGDARAYSCGVIVGNKTYLVTLIREL